MNRIREARKTKGITMKVLGQKIGVAESTVSMYENGKREPDNSTLISIASVLDVSTDYLLGVDIPAENKNQPTAQGSELDARVRDVISRLNEQNTEKMLDYAALLLTSQEK